MENNFEKSLNKEITKRVNYYDAKNTDAKSDFTKLHYFLAALVAVIGLAMAIIGANL